MGACLTRRLRSSDVAARLGGDQFAVLLWAAEETGAITVGWDLVGVIDRICLNSPEPVVAATVSVGLVVLDARARHAPAIMDAANAPLVQAKAAGGHRVAIAHQQANDLQEVGRPGS